MDGTHALQGMADGVFRVSKRRVDEDLSLIGRVASGDKQALGEVYDRFGGALFRYLVTLTGDYQVAEEVLQDTLVAVWRSARTFRGRSSAKTWVFGVARRQAHNTLRRRDLPLTGEDALRVFPDEEAGPEEGVISEVRREELEAAIGRLSPVHREVLVLIFFNELSYEETAEVLGVPIGTVKSRLSNAKKSLRSQLQNPEEV